MDKTIIDNYFVLINKLRGTLRPESIVKILVFSLYLKYSEKITDLFDEKFSLAYLSLTYGAVIQAGDIVIYIEKHEQRHNLEKGLLSNEFSQLLEGVEPEKIRSIFSAVNSVECDYCDLAYALVDYMSANSGKDAGEAYTNPSISRLIGKIADCSEGTSIYDGYCGYGTLINTVADNKGVVHMQDINRSVLAIATLLTLMKGTTIGAIRCGDTNLNPLDISKKYDIVVIDPPYNAKRYEPTYIESAFSTFNLPEIGVYESSYLPVRHAVASLNDEGMALVICPMGMLFSSGKTAAVREIVINNYLDTVIELPNGMCDNTVIPLAIMVLRKNKRDNGVFMINAKSFTEKNGRSRVSFTEEGINTISKMVREKEIVKGISNYVLIEELAKYEYNLCTTRYVSENIANVIQTEDVHVYIQRYSELSEVVTELDNSLKRLRERFVK